MATTTMVETAEGDGEQSKWKQGGYKTLPFIMANEICDRFATAGFNANLITYLTQQLHMPLVVDSNTLTNFGGTTSLTVVLGAFAADAFIGRFWSIVAGSLFYQLGMLGLVMSAVVPSLRPRGSQRASAGQLAVLYLSMLCMHVPRHRRHPAQRRRVRRRPVRPRPEGVGQPEAPLLQRLLLHHGVGGAAGADAGRLHPGQRRLGVGVRDPGHQHVRLHRRVPGRVPSLRQGQARRQPVHEARTGPRRRLQEAQRRRAGGDRHAVSGQGAGCSHLYQRQAPPHGQAQVLGPGGDRDAWRRLRRLRASQPVEAVDGAPRGGAQVHRPHAAHLGGGHRPGHRRLAQRILHHHAGAHHGAPHHPEPGDPAGDAVHLHHRDHAGEHRPVRPRVRAPGAPRHGPPIRGHLLPAHGHRAHHRHLRRRRGRAGGDQASRRRGRPRAPGQPQGRRPDERVLAGAAVRRPRRRRRVRVGRADGVPVRPGAREHAQHGRRALLALWLLGELPEHGARDGGAARHPRRMAAGQHQPGQDRLLLAHHLHHGAQLGPLPLLLLLLHLEATRGGRRSQGRHWTKKWRH